MRFCECGCGEPIRPKRQHKYVPARFLPGHHVKLAVQQGNPPKKRYVPTPEETPSGLCECGCGQKTALATQTYRKRRYFKGYPMPFVQGHYPTNRTRGAGTPHWRGGRQRNYKGYIYAFAPEHPCAVKSPRGYVLEHRLVMEKILSRYLDSHEEVHHRNGIRSDNRPANLELWVKRHPNGQRASDLVAFAQDILSRYGSDAEKLRRAGAA